MRGPAGLKSGRFNRKRNFTNGKNSANRRTLSSLRLAYIKNPDAYCLGPNYAAATHFFKMSLFLPATL